MSSGTLDIDLLASYPEVALENKSSSEGEIADGTSQLVTVGFNVMT